MTDRKTLLPRRTACPVCGGHHERAEAPCDAALLLAAARAVIDYQHQHDPARTAKVLIEEHGATILYYQQGQTFYPRVGGPLDWARSFLAFQGYRRQPASAPTSNEQEGGVDVQD